MAAQQRVYRLQPEALAELADWATRQADFWRCKLHALDLHLQDSQKETPS